MSKSKNNAKTKTAPVDPVVTAPSIAPASGRTVVDIARELKITPQNARRVARPLFASERAKGACWSLTPDQEKILRDALTKPAAVAQ